MINIKQDKEKCTGCSACYHVCPKHCIRMEADSEGFVYPHIDESRCVHCHLCETVCPVINSDPDAERLPEAYAAYSKDGDTRRSSSSGGIFTEIAGVILDQGGVVFGAAFTDPQTIQHIEIDSREELKRLQGSKYVQSDIGNSLPRVRQLLDTGRIVLFSGTPCQIAGLKRYLRKEYSNLVTQDLICHGVPSPMVWKKYVHYVESINSTKITDANFRDKKNGWNTFSLYFQFEDGTEKRKSLHEDLFLRGFLANICLRPSCYYCQFKGLNRPSDITLADFWGIKHVCPEFADDEGTSLVWLNTDQSKMIWENIKDKLVYQNVDLSQAVKYNTAAVSSVLMPEKRNLFFELIRKNDYDSAIKAVLPKENAYKRYIKRIIKTIKNCSSKNMQ